MDSRLDCLKIDRAALTCLFSLLKFVLDSGEGYLHIRLLALRLARIRSRMILGISAALRFGFEMVKVLVAAVRALVNVSSSAAAAWSSEATSGRIRRGHEDSRVSKRSDRSIFLISKFCNNLFQIFLSIIK